MAAFRCSLCERDVKPHCPEGRCDWWICTNRACDAERYDVRHGLLLHSDGSIERLGV